MFCFVNIFYIRSDPKVIDVLFVQANNFSSYIKMLLMPFSAQKIFVPAVVSEYKVLIWVIMQFFNFISLDTVDTVFRQSQFLFLCTAIVICNAYNPLILVQILRKSVIEML